MNNTDQGPGSTRTPEVPDADSARSVVRFIRGTVLLFTEARRSVPRAVECQHTPFSFTVSVILRRAGRDGTSVEAEQLNPAPTGR